MKGAARFSNSLRSDSSSFLAQRSDCPEHRKEEEPACLPGRARRLSFAKNAPSVPERLRTTVTPADHMNAWPSGLAFCIRGFLFCLHAKEKGDARNTSAMPAGIAWSGFAGSSDGL